MNNKTSIHIPMSTLNQLRGTLIRVLSRENLSDVDRLMLRKTQSMSSFPVSNRYFHGKIHMGMANF